MPPSRRTLLALALLGAAQPLLHAAPARSNAPFKRSGADGATDRALAAIASDPACELASLSVLALRHGKPLYAAQLGQRRLVVDDTTALPAGPDTLYRIASISKLVTTIGLLRLLEQGKVALDADVSTYLGFTLRNPHFAERPITLRTLLTHTSSLRDDGGYSWPATTTLASVLGADASGSWASNAGPGDFFTYCNLGFGIIGTIMEAVSGERFDRLMARLVLDTLHVGGGYNAGALRPAELAQLAVIYRKRPVDSETWNSSGPWVAQVDDVARSPATLDAYVIGSNATIFSPTGGLRISARGLGSVMQMLMAGGAYGIAGRQRLLRRETVELMFARQWTYRSASDGDSSRGLFRAWGLGNQQFDRQQRLIAGSDFNAVGHLGDAYGLHSLFLFDRASQTGFVVLIGGSASDLDARQGVSSRLSLTEERVLAALWERTRHA